MRFDYHSDADSLYIHLNPGRKPSGEGGDTVIIGDGCVVDVDDEGVPIGIDFHLDASKVVDLSKLETEGPIFCVNPSGSTDKRVG